MEAIWRRRCRKLFNTLYCCCCYCWLPMFKVAWPFLLFFFCKIFCKSAMHEFRLLNALPLSHARCCCVLALSRALSLCVVYDGSQLLRSLYISLVLAHVKFVPFVRFFLVAKRKFNIFLLWRSVFVIISMNLNA